MSVGSPVASPLYFRHRWLKEGWAYRGTALDGNPIAPLPCIALFRCDHFGMAIHKIRSLAEALSNDPSAPPLLCAVCLERTQEKPQAAVTVANGFALCDGHAASARAGGFEHRMERC